MGGNQEQINVVHCGVLCSGNCPVCCAVVSARGCVRVCVPCVVCTIVSYRLRATLLCDTFLGTFVLINSYV